MGSNPTRPTRRTSSGRGRGDQHRIGADSEVEVIAALHRAGYAVLLPFGTARRYDLVLEHEGTFSRVQVKTGFLDGHGSVKWECRSIRFYDGRSRDYRGEIELFAVWVPETRDCFLVPVAECGRYCGFLRLEPPRNGQHRRVRMAEHYRLRPADRGALRDGATLASSPSVPETSRLPFRSAADQAGATTEGA